MKYADSRLLVLPALTLLLACVSVPAHAAALDEVRELVNTKARALFMKHRRAIKALQSTLRNPAFKAFFMTEDEAQRAVHRADIEQSTLKVQRYFAIEEMCLIDRDGNELVRMVDGALDDHLSDSEENNPFFAPAFLLPEGEVLISEVYVSPDNGRWVQAYVTPIAVAGQNVGLLHYEQEITRIAGELFKELGDDQVLLGFDEGGRLLFDSRSGDALPPPDGAPLPDSANGRTLQVFEEAAKAGSPLDDRAVATKRVRGWTLVALQG